MTLDEVTRLQQRCSRALNDFGASPALKKFCLRVVEYEEETSGVTLRMHEKLRKLEPDGVDGLETLRELVQSMTRDFKNWNQTVDALVVCGSSLPPLQASLLQGRKILAPSSIQTKQLQIEENDVLVVTDASQPNVIKVRTPDGKEDFVPMLVFILPSTDKTVSSLLQRLHVQLLSSWTDCLGQSGKLLLRSTEKAFQSLNLSADDVAGLEMNGSSIISKLNKLHDVLNRLEEDLAKQSKAKTKSKETVASLLQTFNCYQLFYEYWNNFRLLLKGRKPRPICIFEKLEDFKNHVSNNKQLRCYTTTFTVESTEICEETVHVPMSEAEDDASSYGGGGSWKQAIEAEQLTSTSQEEKKRYVIRAVKDPRTGTNVSLQEAIENGIMNMTHGWYVNPETSETKAIALALSEGHIQVDYVTKTRSTPKTEALGLITIRDRIESRKYAISAVIDASTAERVDLSEAKKRGLVDDEATSFIIKTSGERMSMDEAVEAGWVLADYETDEAAAFEESEVRTRTYVIRAVVDQRLKKRVPFKEAVQRRLVDRDTGNYYNNLTGETVHVIEAIRRGFLKGKLIEDPTKLDIDPHNKMVVQSINKMRHIVTGLSAVAAMKEGVNRTSTSSTSST